MFTLKYPEELSIMGLTRYEKAYAHEWFSWLQVAYVSGQRFPSISCEFFFHLVWTHGYTTYLPFCHHTPSREILAPMLQYTNLVYSQLMSQDVRNKSG